MNLEHALATLRQERHNIEREQEQRTRGPGSGHPPQESVAPAAGGDGEEDSGDVHTEQNLEDRLVEIDAALERIDSGTYGRCEECGETIDEERLGALPATRYCRRCAHEGEEPLHERGLGMDAALREDR